MALGVRGVAGTPHLRGRGGGGREGVESTLTAAGRSTSDGGFTFTQDRVARQLFIWTPKLSIDIQIRWDVYEHARDWTPRKKKSFTARPAPHVNVKGQQPCQAIVVQSIARCARPLVVAVMRSGHAVAWSCGPISSKSTVAETDGPCYSCPRRWHACDADRRHSTNTAESEDKHLRVRRRARWRRTAVLVRPVAAAVKVEVAGEHRAGALGA